MGKFVFDTRGRYVYRPNILYRILVKMPRILGMCLYGLLCLLFSPCIIFVSGLYIALAFVGSAVRSGWDG